MERRSHEEKLPEADNLLIQLLYLILVAVDLNSTPILKA